MQLIACNYHAQLVSKPVSEGNFTFTIECDSSAVMNAILPSLSVNYGSVY